jgi:hypothetical protein
MQAQLSLSRSILKLSDVIFPDDKPASDNVHVVQQALHAYMVSTQDVLTNAMLHRPTCSSSMLVTTPVIF